MREKIKRSTFFLFLLICFSNTNAQTRLIDSLENVLQNTRGAGERIAVYIRLSDEYNFVDAEKARKYGFEGLLLARREENEKATASLLRNIGVTHEGQGNYDSALYYQKKSLNHWRSLKDTLEIAGTINNMGVVYDQKGDNDLATQYYLKSARLYEKMDDVDGMAKVYNNLGIIYKKRDQFEKALGYYKNALEIYQLKNHKFGTAVMYSNIGSLHNELGEYEQTLINSAIAVEKYKEINVLQYLPYAYENMAIAHSKLQNPDSAIFYHQEALALYSAYGNQKESASTLNSLAEFSFKARKYNAAIYYADSSLSLSGRIGAKEEKIRALLLLSDIYKSRTEFNMAYNYLKRYILLKDSVESVEKARDIEELQAVYESEKKEQEIKILQAETQLKDLKIITSENRFMALAIISGLIVVIGFLIANRRELKQKTILARERENQRKLQLIKMVEAEEKERKRIARELHDGVGQQLSGIKMAFETLAEEVTSHTPTLVSKFKDITRYLHESSDEVRNISHQMMPLSLVKLGLVPAIQDLLDKTFKYSSIKINFDHFNVDKQRFQENVEVAVYRVAQELINNVIKHSQANEVTFQLIRRKNSLMVIVEDDGIGIKNSTTHGHGLYNIKNRLEAIHGKIHYDNSDNGGTVATLIIPIDEV